MNAPSQPSKEPDIKEPDIPEAESLAPVVLIRCPECRAVFSTSHPNYPRCPKCTTIVVTCRNCRWFEKVTSECTQPVLVAAASNLSETQRLGVQDPDAYIRCDYHDSTLVYDPGEGLSERRKQVLRIGSLAAAGVVAVIVFLWMTMRIPGTSAPPELMMNVQYPNQIEQGRSFIVDCVVKNMEDRESPPISLRLPEAFLQDVELVEVQPTPAKVVVRGTAFSSQGRYFLLGSVPAGGELPIQLLLRSKALGHYRTSLRLDIPGVVSGIESLIDFDVI